MSNTVKGTEDRALASLERMDAILKEKEAIRKELQRLKRNVREMREQDEPGNASIPVRLSA
jgi:hypothetical protein